MGNRCPDQFCACGDRLIHQSARGHNESSSVLGQWVHDEYPRTFDWMDVDGLIWKKSERRMRLIEHKPTGGKLSASQLRVLPIMAEALELAVSKGLMDSAKVIQLNGDPPFDQPATATIFLPDGRRRVVDLDRPAVDQLLTGQVVRPPSKAVA